MMSSTVMENRDTFFSGKSLDRLHNNIYKDMNSADSASPLLSQGKKINEKQCNIVYFS